MIAITCGCGTTREHTATEQLVVSDAVDRSVQNLDFRPLSGHKVYLDASYIRHVKGPGFVNAEYVISALRQQILAAGCLIQDAANEADIIIEARIGTLGSDDHQVTYGIPKNNAVSSAASLISETPLLPSLPEISFARREAREAAAKIAAFAYDRETRKPVWQSGVRHSIATAKDTWVLGVGPFQGGSIRKKTKLAGNQFKLGSKNAERFAENNYKRPPVDYSTEMKFVDGLPDQGGVGFAPGMIATPLVESVEPEKDAEAEKVAEKPDAEANEKR